MCCGPGDSQLAAYLRFRRGILECAEEVTVTIRKEQSTKIPVNSNTFFFDHRQSTNSTTPLIFFRLPRPRNTFLHKRESEITRVTSSQSTNCHGKVQKEMLIQRSSPLASVLLLVASSFAMAQNSTDLSMNGTTEMPTLAPTYLGGISPECANETAAFASNDDLSTALQTLFEQYREDFKDACPLSLTITNCDLTFGAEENITYNSMCEEMGGQVYEHSVILTCGLKPLSVDYDLGLVPECISRQCNISAEGLDIELLTNSNITDFARSLDNGACQAKVEESSATIRDIYALLSLAFAFANFIGL